MTASLLQVTEITKQYPGVLAASKVSFRLDGGEILGLVGKNGAGKSTVIKLLAGIIRPDSGSIAVEGEPIVLANPHDATVLGLSFVHQEFAIAPGLSVAENILLGLGYPKQTLGTIDAKLLNKTARLMLQEIGLSSVDPSSQIDGLSIAEQRMVMIARGLAAKARVLVLDEPTASLTNSEVTNLFRVLRKLAELGTAIIYVSHRLDEIFAITDRVVVMRDGQVKYDGETKKLDRAKLIEHIIGDASGVDIEHRRAARGITAAKSETDVLTVRNLQLNGVIEDVSLSIKHGEILGVAGLVGAGRTELARLIFGADRRDGGTILVNGQAVTIISPRDAMRAGIVLLPEDRRHQGLVMNFDLRENITLPSLDKNRRIRWLPLPNKSNEIAATNVAIAALSIKASGPKHPIAWLSGGNQQKVVLGKWLARAASVFIFDEPTHGVDVGTKEEIYQLMERLAQAGNAILFISSEFPELVGVCNRVIVMTEGRLVGNLCGEDVTESKMLDLCFSISSVK